MTMMRTIGFVAALLSVPALALAGPKAAKKQPPLPADAAAAVSKIRDAATKQDFAALRGLMAKEFSYSAGGGMDADEAIASWKADPKGYAAEIVRVLGRCSYEEAAARVRCATTGAEAYVATLKKTADGWKLTQFEQPH